MRAIIFSATLAISAALTGCSANDSCSGIVGSCVALTVQSPAVISVDSLLIESTGAINGSHKTSGPRASLPIHVALKFPTTVNGSVHLAVSGMLSDSIVGSGTVDAKIVSGQHTSAVVNLSAAAIGQLDMAGASDFAVRDLGDVGGADLGIGGDMAHGSRDMAAPPDMTFVPSTLPSCTNLVTNCGPLINDSCCESPLVPGGMFYRQSDIGTGTPDTNNPATVSDFRLDKYEVTVGRFRRFVNAGLGTQANPPTAGAGGDPYTATSGWDSTWNTNLLANTTALETALQCDSTNQTWTQSAGLDNNPINCVSWYEAFAFCAWDDGFLPTEAQWTYAAYAGGEEMPYPWTGTSLDCTYANYNIGGGALSGACKGGVTVPGAYSPKGDGKWGQSDLQGNLEEWTLDWFSASFINPCTNCADFDSASSYKTVCGGSFALGAFAQVNSWRDDRTGPTMRNSAIGFRCARGK